jgi:hypothetical protein
MEKPKGICWGEDCKELTCEYKTVVKEKPKGGARQEMTGKFCTKHFFLAMAEAVKMNKQTIKHWART